jgi:anti-sigma-K factor RskA
MPWWDPWREERSWRRQHKGVPLEQLRGTVGRDLFWQNPRKQRWARRYLWRKENLWRVDRALIIALIMFVVAVAAVIAGYLNFFLK